jgi:plastocyanin
MDKIMIKVLGIAVSGMFVGFAGMALAHDMGGMADSSAPAAPTQIAATAPNVVTIDNFAFSPGTITVAPGTKVTWTNHDDEPHTVVSAGDPKLFKSGALDTDDVFSFTFDEPGTYSYFCSIHPHMTGTIVVK